VSLNTILVSSSLFY